MEGGVKKKTLPLFRTLVTGRLSPPGRSKDMVGKLQKKKIGDPPYSTIIAEASHNTSYNGAQVIGARCLGEKKGIFK